MTVNSSGGKLSFLHNQVKLYTIDLACVKRLGFCWNLEAAAHLRLGAAICECYNRVCNCQERRSAMYRVHKQDQIVTSRDEQVVKVLV